VKDVRWPSRLLHIAVWDIVTSLYRQENRQRPVVMPLVKLQQSVLQITLGAYMFASDRVRNRNCCRNNETIRVVILANNRERCANVVQGSNGHTANAGIL
jgi:hypothetical protein